MKPKVYKVTQFDKNKNILTIEEHYLEEGNNAGLMKAVYRFDLLLYTHKLPTDKDETDRMFLQAENADVILRLEEIIFNN